MKKEERTKQTRNKTILYPWEPLAEDRTRCRDGLINWGDIEGEGGEEDVDVAWEEWERKWGELKHGEDWLGMEV